MSIVIVNLVLVTLLVAIDQGLKLWATANLQPVGSMPLIPHVIELRYLLNKGAAFSMLNGKQLLLIVITSIALIAVAYWLFVQCRSRERRWERAAMLLVLAGGIGNLIDRIANGYVVDYLNFLFIEFPVFNFADICVCAGVGLYLLYVFLVEPNDQKESE